MSGVETVSGFSSMEGTYPVYSSLPPSDGTKRRLETNPSDFSHLAQATLPSGGFKSSYPLSARHKAAWGLGGSSIVLGSAAIGCFAGGFTLYSSATAESIVLFPFLFNRDFRNVILDQASTGNQLFIAGGVLGVATLGTAFAALAVRFGK